MFRQKVILVVVAVVVAAVGAMTVVVGVDLVSSRHEPDRSERAVVEPGPEAPDLSRELPLMTQGGISYMGENYPHDGKADAIGITKRRALVVSSVRGATSRVTVIDRDGRTVASAKTVKGIAVADLGSDLAAWVEVHRAGGETRFTSVVIDTRTGKNVASRLASSLTYVMAVGADAVAMSDGSRSWLWNRDGSETPLKYVPKNHYVVDLSNSYVVAQSPEGEASVYSVVDGSVVAKVADAFSGTLSPDGRKLVGAADEDGVYELDIRTSKVETKRFPGRMATYWVASGGVAVVAEREVPDYRPVLATRVCQDGLKLCDPEGQWIPASESGASAVLPAEGILQILFQSA